MQELQAFLGLLNYYGRFLYNLSTILAPLHNLLCTGQMWLWGPSQQRSFQRAKELLLSAEVLAHYDPNKPVLLLWTWCTALAHRGRWYRASRWMCIKDTQRCRKKLFTARQGGSRNNVCITTFHKQIYGRCFVIMTDHRPLVSLFGELMQVPVTASPRVQRCVGTSTKSTTRLAEAMAMRTVSVACHCQ